MAYISFGKFGKKEQWGKEKEIFLDELRLLMSRITKNGENKELYAKSNETELAKTLKQMIAKKNYDHSNFDFSISDFMLRLGLSYKILTKSEKKEIFEMEFTYDNWKNKSEILYSSSIPFTKNSKSLKVFEFKLKSTNSNSSIISRILVVFTSSVEKLVR